MATTRPLHAALEKSGSASRAQVWFQVFVLGLLLLLLINYKGAAGLDKVRQTQATGKLPLASLEIGREAGEHSTALSSALAYLRIVWPALVFGILISAATRTSLLRTPLHSLFRGSTVRDSGDRSLGGRAAHALLLLCRSNIPCHL